MWMEVPPENLGPVVLGLSVPQSPNVHTVHATVPHRACWGDRQVPAGQPGRLYTLMLIVTSCHQWPNQEGAQGSDPSGSADRENGLTLSCDQENDS